MLTFEEITQLVALLRSSYQIDKIRLTGGEPLLRKNIVDLVRMLHERGVADLALTTNGQMLAELARPLAAAGLGRINISLDSLQPERYREMTRGGILQQTLDGIAAAHAAGLNPIKLNTVVLRGINDDELPRLLEFSLKHGYEHRFLEIMPIGHGAGINRDNFVAADDILESLRQYYDLKPLGRAPGSSAVSYAVTAPDGLHGVVGVIAPCTAPFCADCHRLRITTDGMLVGCLARAGAIAVRDLLNDPPKFLQAVDSALGSKRHDASFVQPKIMATIGG
jgi:cyclic pyranopterin phosphate synthase